VLPIQRNRSDRPGHIAAMFHVVVYRTLFVFHGILRLFAMQLMKLTGLNIFPMPLPQHVARWIPQFTDGIQDTDTKAFVINADGLTPEEVARELERRK
jgi:hypothetical protein